VEPEQPEVAEHRDDVPRWSCSGCSRCWRPAVAPYRIEVGRRGVVRFSRSGLERSNWKADLMIGASTMFGGI
jgi:hypothetical protein